MLRLPLLIFAILLCGLNLYSQRSSGTIYQLIIYHFQDKEQEAALDLYMEKALVPVLHKRGIQKIGAFKPIANDTAKTKQLYVLLPFRNWKDATEWRLDILKDKDYSKDAAAFHAAQYDKAPYTRMENIYMQSFALAPSLTLPVLSGSIADKVYELRSYESSTEERYRNKVHMFNEGGEIDLFKRLDFNAIFYGDVIAGSRMPNLIYMTSFNNMEQRNEHWKAFGASPEWKRISTMAEYQKNVSKADIILMHAAPYSDY